MTRRRFLQSVGVLLAATGGALVLRGRDGVQLLAERMIDVVWSPNRELRSHYSYLDIDPAGIDTYIQDYERHIRRLSRFTGWQDDVYTRFLLSTDFFQNGADQSRRVRYVSFHHPYVTLCYNPLARFD